MRSWLVFAGTRVALVRARTAREAKLAAVELFDRGRRRLLPFSCPRLVARRATRADIARYRAAEEQIRRGIAS